MRSFMKYFKLFSLFIVFLFSFTQFVFADCPVNLQCGEQLQLNWSHTGSVTGCEVMSPSGPNGEPPASISGTCTSNGWTSNNVPVRSGQYSFSAYAGGSLIEATCNVTVPTNCGSTGPYSISAAPNPVQICSPQTTGKSLISWTAPAGQSVTVRVPSGVFAASVGGSSQWTTNDGSASSPGWIVPGSNITFTLHDSTGALKDSVTVTGTNSGCSTGVGVCGDGTLNSGTNSQGINEQCDDGNIVNGDGCSSTCQIQTAPSAFYCQTTTMCSQCGGTTGITCPTNVYQSSACGGACPAGGVCGNGVLEGTEQCDQGGQNGLPTSTCSLTCTTQTPSLPSADIGFDSAYTKNETITLSAGQTTANATLFLTSANISSGSCNLQKWDGGWQTIGTFSRNIATTQPQSGLVAGVYQYRYACGATYSAQATLTVNSAPAPTAIDIGWTNTYSPKSKTVTVVNGGVTNESLYITTGGRTGCSLSGYMNSSNQVGVSPVSAQPGFAYSVGAPQGNYTYTLTCSGVSPVSATLTVTSSNSGPSVSCTPSPQTIPATFNWSANDFSKSGDVRCTVDGTLLAKGVVSGQFSPSTPGSYVVSCSAGAQSASASCVAQDVVICGDNICNGSETCGTCPNDCGVCSNTLGAACLTGITVPTLKTGESFLVTVPFTNTGSKAWNPGVASYTAKSYSASVPGWVNMTSSVTSVISGTPSSGMFSPIFSLVAPSVAGSFSLSFQMNENNVPFGSSCTVNGATGGIINVVDPECSDGVDNSDAEDAIADYPADPGCESAGDDNETDPAPGVTLKISANPQLVRFGGSSTVTYEVNNCTITNAEGDLVPGTWTLLRDGAQIGTGISGTSTTGGQQSYPVYNIQNKTTFTLSCGGTTRSATISVIKINEI